MRRFAKASAILACTVSQIQSLQHGYEIGGGIVGQTVVLPIGTVYQLQNGNCAFATTTVIVDISKDNLIVAYNGQVQTILESHGKLLNTLSIPAR